jgi:hypothetical protein
MEIKQQYSVACFHIRTGAVSKSNLNDSRPQFPRARDAMAVT